MKYDYILKKIDEAQVINEPFQHLQINDFFSSEHFEEIIQSREVNIKLSKDDNDLFENLFDSGYKIIKFPGCIENKNEYVKWHKTKKVSQKTNTSCEGFGVVLRLLEANSKPIQELMSFLESSEFKKCISAKFGIKLEACSYDQGIQKYLDGYEISPHPDIRKKALTYMVNINPNTQSELEEHHTHYLKFKPDWEYIKNFWKGNDKTDTCWVPWAWCETKKLQSQNNSIVIFSPKHDTLHGVKANYNHLKNQRTQLYGNLWHNASPCDREVRWEDLVISTSPTNASKNRLQKSILGKRRLSFNR